MQPQTAVVIGATGLIGSTVVNYLLNDDRFNVVKLLVRKPLSIKHSKLQIMLVNFDDLNDFKNKLGKGDCIFCCVGTTNKKVKGNNEAYRKIDYDIPINAARLAKKAGFKSYLLVSAVGANTNSSNFYLKLKGEVERDIAVINFESFQIFRPSILLGKRNEFRLGELISKGFMKTFSFLLMGSLKKYKPISANNVAKAMAIAAMKNAREKIIYEYDEMKKLLQ
ncbi:MAG: NAD(P)H-binding protein [Chitinophagaceae bacterium]